MTRDYTTARDIAVCTLALVVLVLALYGARELTGYAANVREGQRIVRGYAGR